MEWALFNLLGALVFLHDEAKMVHTGIPALFRAFELINVSDTSLPYIVLTIDEESALQNFKKAEIEIHPL